MVMTNDFKGNYNRTCKGRESRFEMNIFELGISRNLLPRFSNCYCLNRFGKSYVDLTHGRRTVKTIRPRGIIRMTEIKVQPILLFLFKKISLCIHSIFIHALLKVFFCNVSSELLSRLLYRS